MKLSRKTALAAGLAFGALASVASADLQLFDREGFHGRDFGAQAPVDNLDGTGFNDRAQSAIVRGEPWVVCTDAHLQGQCLTLRPGEYPSLAQLGVGNSISSARPVERYGRNDFDRYDHDRYDHDRGGERWRGEGSRVTLYEGPNFSGRSMTVDRDAIRNLDQTGMNDRVSSLIVEGAPWTFCSDAYFRGDCRTFNPGQYPTLPGELANRISSGHQAGPDGYAEGRRY